MSKIFLIVVFQLRVNLLFWNPLKVSWVTLLNKV